MSGHTSQGNVLLMLKKLLKPVNPFMPLIQDQLDYLGAHDRNA